MLGGSRGRKGEGLHASTAVKVEETKKMKTRNKFPPSYVCLSVCPSYVKQKYKKQ